MITESLRNRMLADLRDRAILVGYPERRAQYVDEAIAGAEIDGGRVIVAVTAADWRDVVEFLDARYSTNLEALGGVLVAALKRPEAWLDAVAAARAWNTRRRATPPSTDPLSGRCRDDARAGHRAPCLECLPPDGCGAPVAAWWDRSDRDVGMRGRWFCTRCGVEWVVGARGGAVPVFDAAPFGGADPAHWTTRDVDADRDAMPPSTARAAKSRHTLRALRAATSGDEARNSQADERATTA